MIISQSKGPLRGRIQVPGDKSISHRAVMFGALARGTTRVRGFLKSDDCLSTISCFQELGIDIRVENGELLISGRGLHGLTAPAQTLFCGNSGTTTRLISGILAGQNFPTRLTGDASICRRPMGRIIRPLSQMGADIKSEKENGCAPLLIHPARLSGIDFLSPVASAQVKSCVLLAGLYADSKTSVTEPYLSRNHTELMLSAMGADITSTGTSATITPGNDLHAADITVPGDISSAAFFIAAASIVPGSEVLIQNVGINPTRDGILKVAEAMGADISVKDRRTSGGEETADLLVRHASLHGTTVSGSLIPTLIDEIPAIAAMACFADGTTVIRDAAELKVKESDRIALVTENFRRLGADITPTDDGMVIHGGRPLHGAPADPAADHRIAMTMAVLGLACDGSMDIKDAGCVNISYPGFFDDLCSLQV